MKKAIGLFEFKSIAKGIEVTDQILKSSNVNLILSNAICPGKYISLVAGEVAAVKNAVDLGKTLGGIFKIESTLISNIHPEVLPALTGTTDFNKIDSIGVIETMSALNSILVGDTALKSSKVQLLEIRIARGLGGKGFTILTGEISSVKKAIAAVEDKFAPQGDLLCTTAIANPNRELIAKLFT
ncbi:BMC domain-containing protein [Irregularibacter muris]|uniref:BMC domain-containing protein n=1 Tax=Irregularibacter muris TaxID=1796619 RepID=A0AAE3HDD7_9FIRM|nr:BMC domain-containing protein [Irregularibacter muris]MCR1898386.1 BMC domain-containing protein [Irregularibacter muris]